RRVLFRSSYRALRAGAARSFKARLRYGMFNDAKSEPGLERAAGRRREGQPRLSAPCSEGSSDASAEAAVTLLRSNDEPADRSDDRQQEDDEHPSELRR